MPRPENARRLLEKMPTTVRPTIPKKWLRNRNYRIRLRILKKVPLEELEKMLKRSFTFLHRMPATHDRIVDESVSKACIDLGDIFLDMDRDPNVISVRGPALQLGAEIAIKTAYDSLGKTVLQNLFPRKKTKPKK